MRGARATEAAAAQAAAGRGGAQVDRRAARGPVDRDLALLHLAQLRRDAALELRWERLQWFRARLAARGDDRAREIRARSGIQIVEEALAAEADHLRRVVVPGERPITSFRRDAQSAYGDRISTRKVRARNLDVMINDTAIAMRRGVELAVLVYIKAPLNF